MADIAQSTRMDRFRTSAGLMPICFPCAVHGTLAHMPPAHRQTARRTAWASGVRVAARRIGCLWKRISAWASSQVRRRADLAS